MRVMRVWRCEAQSKINERGDSVDERDDEAIADGLDHPDPRVRLEAAKALLLRVYGPPPEAHELDDEDQP
jgi:HEAT repeat protein